MQPGEYIQLNFEIQTKEKGASDFRVVENHPLKIYPNEGETIAHVLERADMTMAIMLRSYQANRPDDLWQVVSRPGSYTKPPEGLELPVLLTPNVDQGRHQ